jgi:hypothetical protein
MNRIIALIISLACTTAVYAQPGLGTSTTQPVSMTLADVIEILPATAGSDAAATFSSISDYDGGKFFTNALNSTAGDQDFPDQFQWIVKSTRNFNVWVKIQNPVNPNSTFFHYQGLSSIYNQMTLNKLLMKVSQKNTGASSTTPVFGGWASLDLAGPGSPNGKLVIQNGQMGVRDFRTIYKVSPAYHYAAGTYVARIVYTATQL